nr:MAG TPA_asm: hypothetical protein [Caudoviricetes sp.]DAM75987.1 MAG TPA: hypothetical protein [Caudoviricetes sp.]DAT74632.1 MAG TPA: hypothetical protein [Caudoviricetes sp.]
MILVILINSTGVSNLTLVCLTINPPYLPAA